MPVGGEGVPRPGLLAEEGLGLLCVGGEDGLEHDGEVAEVVEGCGEDLLRFGGVGLDECPGGLGVEVLVGFVGHFAQEYHDAAEVAVFVSGGDVVALSAEALEQGGTVGF